jgi:GH15 family glucan-1,4-alpha-glucosidase
MVRHIVLGNGSLLVNIDKWLQVRDIFFPHVGQYNHLLGHAHRIAVLEGDSVSWVNEQDWERKLAYLDETLVTNSLAVNNEKKISLLFNENVYCEDNIFFRSITVKNNADHERNIRTCFHHDFHLYGDGIGDTAFYSPNRDALIHYKRSVYFLISICNKDKRSAMSDFDIGEHVNPGWNLGKNPISQGEVDSIVCIDLKVPAHGRKSFCYYLVAGTSLEEIYNLQDKFLRRGVNAHLKHTQMCQRAWLSGIKPDISVLSKRLQELYKRSLLILKTQIDKNGAITAANDSDNMQYNKDTYSYVWPRDGAIVSIALIKAGFPDIVKPFFEFCRDVLYEEGCLLHKYNPDKTLGSSWHPWILNGKFSLPIQEDETALVLYALWIHYKHTKDTNFIKHLYPSLIKPMGDFLSRHRYKNGLPKESYDLWEERRAIFTFTTSAVLAGLVAAEKLGHIFSDESFCKRCNTSYDVIKEAMVNYLYNHDNGYFRRSVSFEQEKMVYDDAMDSSVYGLFEFEVFDENDQRVVSTMNLMREWLWVKTDVGGIARYHNDYYHKKSGELDKVPGNPWFICTLWYAKWLIKKAKTKRQLSEALDIINWVADHSLPTGVLAEQVHPYTGEPLSVSPLSWSHAEFIDTITNYVETLRNFGKRNLRALARSKPEISGVLKNTHVLDKLNTLK